VVVEYEKRDRYERNLGKVLLGSENMNLEQVRTGLAWHYKKYQGEQSVSDRVKYSDAEMDTRRHERGLWSDRVPVPPWDYRQGKRKQKKAMEAFTIRSQANDKPY
jgi:endonuclease YncB( thermonuclease family)